MGIISYKIHRGAPINVSTSEKVLLIIMLLLALYTVYEYWPSSGQYVDQPAVVDGAIISQNNEKIDRILDAYLESAAFEAFLSSMNQRLEHKYQSEWRLINQRVQQLSSYADFTERPLFSMSRSSSETNNKEQVHSEMKLVGTIFYGEKKIALMRRGKINFQLASEDIGDENADSNFFIEDRRVIMPETDSAGKREFRIFMR